MKIHVTTVPSSFTDIKNAGAPAVASDRLAHRVKFVPCPTGPGVYAEVPVPYEGFLNSVGLRLEGIAPAGDLFISPVNPTTSYDGFFLYAVLDDIPRKANGPAVWRKTELHDIAYSTVQFNAGMLYFLILNGPSAEVYGDVALVAETQ